MILTLLLSLVDLFLDLLFGLLPNLPQMDSSLLLNLNNFVNLIFNHLDLLGFFIDISLVKTLVPWVIIVVNFEHIYHFTMWIIRKIPLLNFN